MLSEGDGGAPADDRTRLGFRRHLRATVVPGEAVYLVSHRGVTALHGDPAEVLAPLLDGSRSPAEVLGRPLPPSAPRRRCGRCGPWRPPAC